MHAQRATPEVFHSERELQLAYQRHRYLQDLSHQDLQQYGQDAFRNLLTVNHEGKTAPYPIDHPRHWYWRVRIVHFLEELALRTATQTAYMSDDFVNGLKLPRPNTERTMAALTAVDRHQLVDGQYLVKYGKSAHVADMRDHGLLKITPASEYSRPEYNDAIRDSELQFTYHLYNPTASLLALHGGLPVTGSGDSIHLGTALLERTINEDYFLFCLSASYDPRLFDDFEADACLIIDKPKEFRDRLLAAAAEQLNSHGHAFGMVEYVDPFSEPSSKHRNAFQKHHRYSYQDEVRAVWLVTPPMETSLNSQLLRLGSLEDIAHVVDLKLSY